MRLTIARSGMKRSPRTRTSRDAILRTSVGGVEVGQVQAVDVVRVSCSLAAEMVEEEEARRQLPTHQFARA